MRDILLKIIEKLHTICASLAETKNTTDELSTAVSAMGKTVFKTTEVTVSADTVVPANGGMVELNSGVNLDTLLPDNAIFISASLKGGSTAHMGELILHKVWWSSTPLLGFSNPTATAITIPANKVVEIVYAV